MESAAPVSMLVVVAFIFALSLAIGSFAAVPAYILWRMTKDKRYPLAWVTCCSLVVLIAAGLTYLQRPFMQPPTPINETFTDVADDSGVLHVTAIRLPRPELMDAQIEIDAENTSDAEQLLGFQYSADGGTAAGFSPGTTALSHIWPIPPKTKTTLATSIKLPGFVQGGNISIVLARCAQREASGVWLPDDSEAFYQNRFTLVATPPPVQ